MEGGMGGAGHAKAAAATPAAAQSVARCMKYLLLGKIVSAPQHEPCGDGARAGFGGQILWENRDWFNRGL
jgi:hypothetical protein